MPIRILIVDDSDVFNRNMKRALLQNEQEDLKRDVVAVNNAVNALNTALEFNPHIILLDKGLGDNMNGLSLLSALQSIDWRSKTLERNAPRLVCLVSADVDEASVEISEVLGIKHVIPKQMAESMARSILEMVNQYELDYGMPED